MRADVVPKNMRKHADALVDAVGQLEPLLDRNARASSHVARARMPRSVEERRAAFEDIIHKAEAVIRQVRIQGGEKKQTYEIPVIIPILERLGQTVSTDMEAQQRGLDPLQNFRAIYLRTTVVDQLRSEVHHYAQGLSVAVTPDTLWNAYRMDFRGRNKEWLTTQEWQENTFVKHMPETMAALQPLLQMRAAQKLADKISKNNNDPEKIARALDKFLAKLGPHHRIEARIAEPLRQLRMPSISDEMRINACNILVDILNEEAQTTSRRLESPRGYHEFLANINQGYEDDKANFMKKFLVGEEEQIGLFDDPKARAKRDAEIQSKKEKGFAKMLESAPHLRDKISAIRAEAALQKIDKVLEPHWRAVSDLYPYRGQGQDNGAGAEKPPKAGRDGRG
jgi:hypothetical protein